MTAKISPAICAAGLLAGLAGLYLLCLRAYYVGFFNDDAFYLIGARSLLRGGFRELNAPGAPPLVHYLPGYPALLAPWLWLFGDSFRAAQLLSVLLSVGGLALTWLCFSAELPAGVAWAAVAAAGFNPLTASVSGAVLSDLPYFALTPLVFLAARAAWDGRRPAVWAGLGALCGAAFLVRPTGAAFALALVLCLLWERRWRDAFWAAAGAAAVAAPWLLRNWLAGGPPLSHGSELAAPGARAFGRACGRAWRATRPTTARSCSGARFSADRTRPGSRLRPWAWAWRLRPPACWPGAGGAGASC
ncbi:MAG: glycosyltransferase family 39 protein [Elusimicrobia bacterium]|nr:glycosyltransferase family 39 protein [Elusimicrobiota bacterium]